MTTERTSVVGELALGETANPVIGELQPLAGVALRHMATDAIFHLGGRARRPEWGPGDTRGRQPRSGPDCVRFVREDCGSSRNSKPPGFPCSSVIPSVRRTGSVRESDSPDIARFGERIPGAGGIGRTSALGPRPSTPLARRAWLARLLPCRGFCGRNVLSSRSVAPFARDVGNGSF